VLDGESDRVTERRLVTGEADLALVEQGGDGLEVGGHGRLQEGSGSEQHEAHAIAVAIEGKLAGDGAHHAEAVDRSAANREVLGRHAPGEVEGEHQVASPGFDGLRRTQPLRLRRGADEEHPGRGLDQQRSDARTGRAPFALGRECLHAPVERDAQRAAAMRCGRAEPPHQRRQRQQQERPGQPEVDHAAAPIQERTNAIHSSGRTAARRLAPA
jgi:hypothetical protein